MYDGKHRALEIDASSVKVNKYLQSGIKEYLLCAECEGKISVYESKFYQEWFGQNRPSEMEQNGHGWMRDLCYSSHKLFHLSVLFRAHCSKSSIFSEVRLPERHVETIRRLLVNGNAPDSMLYPIICFALKLGNCVEQDLVGHTHRVRVEGHWAYNFVFAGGQWFYYISTHGLSKLFEARLKEDGTMYYACANYLAMEKVYRKNFRNMIPSY